MSEQKKIPAPILDNLRKAAQQYVVEAAKEQEEESLKRVIADLEGKLAAKRADLATAGRERAEAADDAGHYRDMAWGRAAHLELPKELMEAAEKAAREAVAPAPPEYGPNDVRPVQHGTCVHCGQPVHFGTGDQWWSHDATGASPCNPEHPNNWLATPVPEADPLGLDRTTALPLPPKEVAR